jgi:hypothetical protein
MLQKHMIFEAAKKMTRRFRDFELFVHPLNVEAVYMSDHTFHGPPMNYMLDSWIKRL